MCRTQCVLGLAALYVGLVHSFYWDFAAVSTSNQIEFYTNGSKTHSVNIEMPYNFLTCQFYDEVTNKMFIVNTDIFSYDMTTKKTEISVHVRNYEFIMDIAFDPVEQMLFWIEPHLRNIKWFSLKPGSKNDLDGNILFKLHAGIDLLAITVDSCKRYIYWSSAKLIWVKNKFTSTIERARLDGSKREVIISNIRLPLRNCLAIDQKALKLYWIVREPLEVYSIERADLDGNNKQIYFVGTKSEPSILTISKGYIYLSFWYLDTALQLPTIPPIHEQLKEISLGPYRTLAPTNKIDDKIQGCEELRGLLSNSLVTDGNASTKIPPLHEQLKEISLEPYRVLAPTNKIDDQIQGSEELKGLLSNSLVTDGNASTNISSDVSVCHNYCLNGECNASTVGVPKCRCNNGYSGERCEVNMCQSYCLNDGVCSLNDNRQPICQCNGNYAGERCDVSAFLMKCFQTVTILKDILNADLTSITFDKENKSTCGDTVFATHKKPLR